MHVVRALLLSLSATHFLKIIHSLIFIVDFILCVLSVELLHFCLKHLIYSDVCFSVPLIYTEITFNGAYNLCVL